MLYLRKNLSMAIRSRISRPVYGAGVLNQRRPIGGTDRPRWFRNCGGPFGSTVELDDQVCIDIEGDLIGRGQGGDAHSQLGGVELHPTGDFVPGEGFHVFSGEFVCLGFDRDYITDLDREARAVDFFPIDRDVAVGDHLACGPDCPGEPGASDDVVQAAFEQLEQQLAGVACFAACIIDIATELFFHHMVVIAELLFFVETDAVITQAPASESVDTGAGELAFGGVLWVVGDGDADASREFDLGSEVASH